MYTLRCASLPSFTLRNALQRQIRGRFFGINLSTSCHSPSSADKALKVIDPGTWTLVQSYPGREGFNRWRVGIPPSGPMDDFSCRIANRLVGNEESAPALEITIAGPTIQFQEDAVIAVTGAPMDILLNGRHVESWKSFKAKKGSTLEIKTLKGEGVRAYLATSGGLDVEEYLGSASSFPMGRLGGPLGDGQPLVEGIELGVQKTLLPDAPQSTPPSLVPSFNGRWEVDAMLGPQEAPDYFTNEDIETIFSSNYEVSHILSRLGVRLIGPKPKFSRPDGGEGGGHPSNINDNPYAIGSVSFTGDTPVVLTCDGPSLGGFACPITIPSYDLWKIGQAQPGNKIRFRRVTLDYALAQREIQNEAIRNLGQRKPTTPPVLDANIRDEAKKHRGLLHEIHPEGGYPVRVQYRIAGDRHLLVEYGDSLQMDINSRVRVHLLEQLLLHHKPAGLIDTIPGVRSLSIKYDNEKLSLEDLMKLLMTTEEQLPKNNDVKLKSRIWELPLAFDDRWSREAIDRYMKTIKSEASYLPDNVDFVARNNGLAGGVGEVERIVMDASYLVLGLGDVYLGAPCAVAMDPRHRLVVPKYSPVRTYTPEGAVGLGGMYMCIYPAESPGGYQLVGRTLPIWNTPGDLPNFSPDKPWLLDMFDQVRFKRVEEDALEEYRNRFKSGQLVLQPKEDEIDVKAYNQFLESVAQKTKQLKETQKKANDGLKLQEELKELRSR